MALRDTIKVGDSFDEFGRVWTVTRLRRRGTDRNVWQVEMKRDDFDSFGKNRPVVRTFHVRDLEVFLPITKNASRDRRSRSLRPRRDVQSASRDPREDAFKKHVKRAAAAAHKADHYAEQAAMASFEAFRLLQFGRVPLTAEGERAKGATDKAHDRLSDARHALGDAVWQLEEKAKTRG